MKLKIFDKINNNLIELKELLYKIHDYNSNLLNGSWQIVNGAYGYGDTVCQIENALKGKDKYIIDYQEISKIIFSNDQYFYNLFMKNIINNIEIGIIDSTYLLFSSEDKKLINDLSKYFLDISITV